MRLTPKNWAEFQQYKDRCPPWIKLHRKILDDYDFYCLPVASKALAPMLWLLASESKDGVIDASLRQMAFRLHMTEAELAEALNPLIESKFFELEQDASEMLADRKRGACPEREGETQEQTETESPPVASATRRERFEEFWKEYPKRRGDNPKNPARKLFEAAVKQGVDPDAILRGLRRAKEKNRDKIGTEFIPQAVKWLRDRRWEDYQDSTDPPPNGLAIPNELAVQLFKGGARWNHAFGPEPGKPGCRASPELLAKFGYQSEAA